MKASLYTLALLLAGMFFLASCRKDIPGYTAENFLQGKTANNKHNTHGRPLKATMDVYQEYIPDYANGGSYNAPWLPGEMAGAGEGNSTLLGKFYSLSNLYSYYGPTGAQVTYSVPVPGEYYNQLKPYFTTEEVQALKERQVEVLFFDHQGNAIWSEIDTLYMVPSPTNSLHFSLEGIGRIKGGIGKFATTTSGFYHFNGYADVFRDSAPGVLYQHYWLKMEGTIEY